MERGRRRSQDLHGCKALHLQMFTLVKEIRPYDPRRCILMSASQRQHHNVCVLPRCATPSPTLLSLFASAAVWPRLEKEEARGLCDAALPLRCKHAAITNVAFTAVVRRKMSIQVRKSLYIKTSAPPLGQRIEPHALSIFHNWLNPDNRGPSRGSRRSDLLLFSALPWTWTIRTSQYQPWTGLKP